MGHPLYLGEDIGDGLRGQVAARQELERIGHLHPVIATGIFAQDLQPALAVADLADRSGVVRGHQAAEFP